MKSDSKQRELPWGHLVLMIIFVLATLAFLYDTLRQSWRLENVIVILPVSALILLLCAFQVFKIFLNQPAKTTDKTERAQQNEHNDKGTGLSTSARIGLFMALLGLYVLGLIYFYFDISTFLFVWLALLAQGERHYVFGVIYSLLLSTFVIWGLKQMVPFPITTLIF